MQYWVSAKAAVSGRLFGANIGVAGVNILNNVPYKAYCWDIVQKRALLGALIE